VPSAWAVAVRSGGVGPVAGPTLRDFAGHRQGSSLSEAARTAITGRLMAVADARRGVSRRLCESYIHDKADRRHSRTC
jgi:hypothetical protein